MAKLTTQDIARLLAENEALKLEKARRSRGAGTSAIECKIGQAGGLVMRFPGYHYPVNMTLDQWDTFQREHASVKAFVEQHRDAFRKGRS